jgi:tight adherence protein C
VVGLDYIITFLAGLAVASSIAAIIFTCKRRKLVIMQRLKDLSREADEVYLPPALNRPLTERLGSLLGQFTSWTSARFVPKNKMEMYEKKLMIAGYPLGLNPESYVVLRFLIVAVAVLAGVMTGDLLWLLLLAILGLMLPDLFLKSRERSRKEEMLRSLPDILDLLCVSVEAGLSFDSAVQKVVEKFPGPLSKEFEKALQEISMGKPRREALRDMSQRLNIDEITVFLGSVIQADQLGVSIGNVLRVQSSQVRMNRRVKAEETAQKAPIKILIPMVIFIFPTIMIVLLGPAVLQLMDNL